MEENVQSPSFQRLEGRLVKRDHGGGGSHGVSHHSTHSTVVPMPAPDYSSHGRGQQADSSFVAKVKRAEEPHVLPSEEPGWSRTAAHKHHRWQQMGEPREPRHYDNPPPFWASTAGSKHKKWQNVVDENVDEAYRKTFKAEKPYWADRASSLHRKWEHVPQTHSGRQASPLEDRNAPSHENIYAPSGQPPQIDESRYAKQFGPPQPAWIQKAHNKREKWQVVEPQAVDGAYQKQFNAQQPYWAGKAQSKVDKWRNYYGEEERYEHHQSSAQHGHDSRYDQRMRAPRQYARSISAPRALEDRPHEPQYVPIVAHGRAAPRNLGHVDTVADIRAGEREHEPEYEPIVVSRPHMKRFRTISCHELERDLQPHEPAYMPIVADAHAYPVHFHTLTAAELQMSEREHDPDYVPLIAPGIKLERHHHRRRSLETPPFDGPEGPFGTFFGPWDYLRKKATPREKEYSTWDPRRFPLGQPPPLEPDPRGGYMHPKHSRPVSITKTATEYAHAPPPPAAVPVGPPLTEPKPRPQPRPQPPPPAPIALPAPQAHSVAQTGHGEAREVSRYSHGSGEKSTHVKTSLHDGVDRSGGSTARTMGAYTDREGHNVAYTREVYTTNDPSKQFSMLTEEERRVTENPIQNGVIARQSTTKYYKKCTYTNTTKTTTSSSETKQGSSGMEIQSLTATDF